VVGRSSVSPRCGLPRGKTAFARRRLAARFACGALLAFGVLLGTAGPAWAEKVPMEGPQDPRIRTVVYNPRDVVRIDATYGYHTVVELAEDEVIQSLVIGDSVAWEAEKSAAGNRIFLKPKEDQAATNLTVITDRRTYSFALQASRGAARNKMTWRLRFEYPEDESLREERVGLQKASLVNPDSPAGPGRWNFDYSYGGKDTFRPVQLFDDGEFTYFKWKPGQELPAIFAVGEDKSESLVNSRVAGEYVVVHRVAQQFALRSGDALTCIFNEAYAPRKGAPVNGPTPAKERTVLRRALERVGLASAQDGR
jgi:type IV secretion system protein VirB9